NPDLADVVQQPAELEPPEAALVEIELVADAQRKIGTPACVHRRVLVIRLERIRKGLDGRHECLLETLVVARIGDRELRLVREAAEQAELTLTEVAFRQSGDDAADLAADAERRDRVRGIEGNLFE